MTRYAVDETRGELIAVWDTGHGAVAVTVSTLPAGLDAPQRLRLAANLSALSRALWRCYTHPASAADSFKINSEGWRREQTRAEFANVVGHIRKPNLVGDDGSLIVAYDVIEESANRVGRALHAAADAALTAAVIAEVETELAAVERAELGDLSGRSVQAVKLTRQDASPPQVAVADEILAKDPLGGHELFLDIEPTSACVAVAHWLKAAADVASRQSGHEPTRVIMVADDISAIPVETPTEVLERLEAGQTPTAVVTSMVRDAMAVAAGEVPDVDDLIATLDEAVELADDHAADDVSRAALLGQTRLTPLDPQRPARDMLEDLLTGIMACWLVFYEYADRPDVDVDEDDNDEDKAYEEIHEQARSRFRDLVGAEARAKRDRLAL